VRGRDGWRQDAGVALPSAYLTSTKNVASILDAIRKAQAPPRFTQRFLEGLGFAGVADRLMINVLKALRFLTDTGEPAARYHEFLDASRSKSVLADGIREAYGDLFQINNNANAMSRADVKNKLKTLSQGQYSDSVLDKMASTFRVLCDSADFSAAAPAEATDAAAGADAFKGVDDSAGVGADAGAGGARPRVTVDGLVYSINIHLPESRDPAVYDALFRSLREHLL
jgi:hypothetical protein